MLEKERERKGMVGRRKKKLTKGMAKGSKERGSGARVVRRAEK